MLDVPCARWIVGSLALVSDNFLECRKGLVQVHAVTASDIEDLARDGLRRSLACQQVRGDNILNKSEVAALRAIAVNGRLLAAQHDSDELGHHARVLRCWILPRSKYIEVPQRDRFQSIAAVKRLHVEFSRQLGYSVWRNRIGKHFFMLG